MITLKLRHVHPFVLHLWINISFQIGTSFDKGIHNSQNLILEPKQNIFIFFDILLKFKNISLWVFILRICLDALYLLFKIPIGPDQMIHSVVKLFQFQNERIFDITGFGDVDIGTSSVGLLLVASELNLICAEFCRLVSIFQVYWC